MSFQPRFLVWESRVTETTNPDRKIRLQEIEFTLRHVKYFLEYLLISLVTPIYKVTKKLNYKYDVVYSKLTH